MTTLGELVIEAIITRKEFCFLDVYHKRYFKEPLSTYYVNMTLDLYNDRKDIGVIASTRLSLLDTLSNMKEDYELKLDEKYYWDSY